MYAEDRGISLFDKEMIGIETRELEFFRKLKSSTVSNYNPTVKTSVFKFTGIRVHFIEEDIVEQLKRENYVAVKVFVVGKMVVHTVLSDMEIVGRRFFQKIFSLPFTTNPGEEFYVKLELEMCSTGEVQVSLDGYERILYDGKKD